MLNYQRVCWGYERPHKLYINHQPQTARSARFPWMAVWPTAGTECLWCTRTPCQTAHPDATSMVFFSQQQGFSEDWWKPAIHKSMRSFCHSIWRSLRIKVIKNVSLPELITANESAKNEATSWYPFFSENEIFMDSNGKSPKVPCFHGHLDTARTLPKPGREVSPHGLTCLPILSWPQKLSAGSSNPTWLKIRDTRILQFLAMK